MAYLGTPSATKEIINKYSFAFQKKFGQNFLIDSNVLESIIRGAEITKDDMVSNAVYYGEFQYQAAMLST